MDRVYELWTTVETQSTMDRCLWKVTELTRARLVAAPELKGVGQGGETGLGNPFQASSEGERQRGGRATRRRSGGRGSRWGRVLVRETRRGELVRGL
jgi:hypothetical protein